MSLRNRLALAVVRLAAIVADPKVRPLLRRSVVQVRIWANRADSPPTIYQPSHVRLLSKAEADGRRRS